LIEKHEQKLNKEYAVAAGDNMPSARKHQE